MKKPYQSLPSPQEREASTMFLKSEKFSYHSLCWKNHPFQIHTHTPPSGRAYMFLSPLRKFEVSRLSRGLRKIEGRFCINEAEVAGPKSYWKECPESGKMENRDRGIVHEKAEWICTRSSHPAKPPSLGDRSTSPSTLTLSLTFHPAFQIPQFRT